jgi:hypothetical protein
MIIRQVALVCDTDQLDISDVTRVAAALQKQVTRDFGPIWEISATVDGFARLEDVPIGYWPILVGDEGQRGGGVHLDKGNQPFALVDFTPEWPLTASHECLEMLADPFGNRLVAGDSPMPGQGRVEFLLEVCDPCEAPEFGYTVNGILVSDFYTPLFFDPPQRGDVPVRYDFQGHITEPRQVLGDGYLSWHDPVTDHWFQETMFGGQQEFPDLGVFEASGSSIREWVDQKSLERRNKVLAAPRRGAPGMLVALRGQGARGEDRVSRATHARAESLRAQIATLRRGGKPSGR